MGMSAPPEQLLGWVLRFLDASFSQKRLRKVRNAAASLLKRVRARKAFRKVLHKLHTAASCGLLAAETHQDLLAEDIVAAGQAEAEPRRSSGTPSPQPFATRRR